MYEDMYVCDTNAVINNTTLHYKYKTLQKRSIIPQNDMNE